MGCLKRPNQAGLRAEAKVGGGRGASAGLGSTVVAVIDVESDVHVWDSAYLQMMQFDDGRCSWRGHEDGDVKVVMQETNSRRGSCSCAACEPILTYTGRRSGTN